MAALSTFHTPTLEQVEKHRTDLRTVTALILGLVAGGIALLTLLPVEVGGTAGTIRISLAVLTAAFALYVVDKEAALRKLSRALINERVLGAALANRLKEISLLTEAGKAVVASLELDDVLHIILQAAFELLEADEGSVMLVDRGELVVAAAIGGAAPFIGDRRPMTDGLAGHVASTGDPLLIEGRPGRGELAALVNGRRIVSAVSVPLAVQGTGDVLGVLSLDVKDGERRFNEYDLRALGLFAEHAAMAIHHAHVLRGERDLRLKIAELDRVRAELVASMAHDIKTPLTTILGVAKSIRQRIDTIEPAKRDELLAALESQAVRLLGLIERLLEAARSQARHLPLTSEPVDVAAIASALAESRGLLHDRRIAVTSESGASFVRGDREAVEQVVTNLVDNAMKYAEGDVDVRIERREDTVHVHVSDEGPGIAAEDLEHLFMPFRRMHTDGSGVGLGLFITANLVKAMGGDVKAANTPRGATFEVTLPVA